MTDSEHQPELRCPIEPDGWCPKMDTVAAVQEHLRRDHEITDVIDVLIRHTYIMVRMAAAAQEMQAVEYQAEREIDALVAHPTDQTMIMEVEFNEQ